MKLKDNLSDDFLENVAGVIDNEGLGYMILGGGLEPCTPEAMLDNDDDIKKVREALEIVNEYASLMSEL